MSFKDDEMNSVISRSRFRKNMREVAKELKIPFNSYDQLFPKLLRRVKCEPLTLALMYEHVVRTLVTSRPDACPTKPEDKLLNCWETETRRKIYRQILIANTFQDFFCPSVGIKSARFKGFDR